MDTNWILVSDSSRARLFEELASSLALREIADFANPEGRAMDRERTSDAQGRYSSNGEIGKSHTDAADISAAEHATDVFAKEMVDYLEKGRVEHRYGRLVVMAPPRFLGKLRSNIGKDLKEL